MKIIMDRTPLERFGTCPHQGNLCNKNNYPVNDELPVGGVLIHKMIENAFEKHRIEGTTAYQLDKVAEEVIDQIPNTRPDLSMKIKDSCKYVADTIASLADIPIVGVEMQIEAVIEPDELKTKVDCDTDKTVVITQCLDLLQYGRNSLHYRDWKSGYKKRSNEDAKNEFQSACAAWLLMRNYDGTRVTEDGEILPKIDTVHTWYHEVRWRTTAYARFDRESENPSQPHLPTYKMIEHRVLNAVKLWLEGCDEAWPEPKKCGLCPAIRDCTYADPTIKEIADDPQAYVDKYVVIDALRKTMYNALSKYHQGHGRIEGSDIAFDWIPSTKYTPKLVSKVRQGEPDEELEKHFG